MRRQTKADSIKPTSGHHPSKVLLATLALVLAVLVAIALPACSGSSDGSSGGTDAERDYGMTDEEIAEAHERYGDTGWYGWVYFYNATGDLADYEGYGWDVCGEFTFADETMPVAELVLRSSEPASDGGYIPTLDCGIQFMSDDEWSIAAATLLGDLQATTMTHEWLEEYPNILSLTGQIANDGGSVEFVIQMARWGVLWDDYAQAYPDAIPMGYDSWYLPLIEAGEDMPR